MNYSQGTSLAGEALSNKHERRNLVTAYLQVVAGVTRGSAEGAPLLLHSASPARILSMLWSSRYAPSNRGLLRPAEAQLDSQFGPSNRETLLTNYPRLHLVRRERK